MIDEPTSVAPAELVDEMTDWILSELPFRGPIDLYYGAWAAGILDSPPVRRMSTPETPPVDGVDLYVLAVTFGSGFLAGLLSLAAFLTAVR